ncbi:MAG TPA: type II secretion system minor pseudopilin GspI [Marinobacter sp.]|nr:type II secretion system minor pseudopilin GspI [Marinobacter sp.]
MKGHERGFTLIEVMVALVVVAVALPAMMLLITTQLQGASFTREKTQAFWIAENQLTRINLRRQLLDDYTLPRTENGNLNSNGIEWFWQIETEDTEVPGFKRLDIEVYLDTDRQNPLATLTGFMDE